MKGYWKVWAVEDQGTEADVPIGLVQIFWVYVWDSPTSVDAWVCSLYAGEHSIRPAGHRDLGSGMM